MAAAPRTIPRWPVGGAGFLLMVGVGSMYGMSAVQVELPRLLGLTPAWSLAPFAAASLGLALGSGIGGQALARMGARAAAMTGAVIWGLGSSAAGFALIQASLAGTLAGFAAGGIGVGIAYLTIVATVGPSFPDRPLIGSAIGPLGFASGTCLFFLIAIGTALDRQDNGDAGNVLIMTGLGITLLALIAGWGMPARSAGRTSPGEAELPSVAPARRFLSLLLFANALPGMLLFAAVVPVMSSFYGTSDRSAAELLIAAITVALFLGGLFAPGLRARLGARKAIIVLLLGRALLLMTLPFVPGVGAGIVLIAAVLFGHGAGFSLLPGLMKAQDVPSRFAANYGRVLIAWGLAGVAGVGLAGLSVSVTGGYSFALFSAGGIALLAALMITIRGGTNPALT